MSPFPLRCPSCDHGNPAGANFCNSCGVPVNLEACVRCDAINHRGTDRCHKCGAPLSLPSELQSIPATAVAEAITSSDGGTTGEPRTLFRESQPDSDDATVHERGANTSGCTEHTVGAGAFPRQPGQQDLPVPIVRPGSESAPEVVTKRRGSGMRAAAMVVMVTALAVPGYLAYQDPALRGGLDAITPRLDGSSDVQSTPSAQLIPVDNPVSQPGETTQALQSPQAADATRESQLQPANTAIETPLPPPQAAGDFKSPQSAKSARQPPMRSSASASKQGGSSRKAVKPKASDARTRAKSSSARLTEPKEKAAGSEK